MINKAKFKLKNQNLNKNKLRKWKVYYTGDLLEKDLHWEFIHGQIKLYIIRKSVSTQVRSFFCSGLDQIRSRLEQFL